MEPPPLLPPPPPLPPLLHIELHKQPHAHIRAHIYKKRRHAATLYACLRHPQPPHVVVCRVCLFVSFSHLLSLSLYIVSTFFLMRARSSLRDVALNPTLPLGATPGDCVKQIFYAKVCKKIYFLPSCSPHTAPHSGRRR